MQTKFTFFIRFLIPLSLFVLPLSSYGVSGDVSGTWTAAGSPYVIDGDTIIPAGSSLTVEPGVSVLFTGSFAFTVNGTLTAEGTSAQPIIFTRAQATDESRWKGIIFAGADDNSILDYCNITYTYKYSSTASEVRGGAIKIISCSPTVRNCSISDNFTRNDNQNGSGGAIYIEGDSTAVIEFNHLHDNESDSGGAISVFGNSLPNFPVIRHNLIEDNSASYSGGGIHLNQGFIELDSNIIRYNTDTSGTFGGGGIALWNSGCDNDDCNYVYNNIIYGNSAVTGGGIYNRYTSSNLINNTIVGNSATNPGGGLYSLSFSDSRFPHVTNTILWSNNSDQIAASSGSDIIINYSNIQGGEPAGITPGTGNINLMPLFSNPVVGDFQLLSGSPGIDVGSNSVSYLPTVDFGGRARILNGGLSLTVDMGAFEFDPSAPLHGDINGDQQVDLEDAILVLQLLSGQDIGLTGDITGIDVNQDNTVGLAEAIFALQYSALTP